MKKGIKMTVATFKVNVPFPIDDRKVLSSAERVSLESVRRYKWMIVIDEDTGARYQLQPNKNGGSINDPLSIWQWYVIDSSSVLTSSLTVYQDTLSIPAGTVFEAGTTLETVVRQMFAYSRSPILPTISISNLGNTLVEKGSSGRLELTNPQFNLGDSPDWEEVGYRRYIDVDGAVAEIFDDYYDYSNIILQHDLSIKRNYLEQPQVEPMNASLPAGEAESNNVSAKPVLPVLIGVGTSDYWYPHNITESWLNQRLLNGQSSYIKVLMNPNSIIEVPMDMYNDSYDKFRWIAIPASWNKEIIQYRANSFDFGQVGESTELFSTIRNYNLTEANNKWVNEPYIFYCTNYRTTFQYSEEELFKFLLT